MARHAARPARAARTSWRKRLAAALTATAIAVVGLVAVPTAAFATHPSLNGKGPECVSEAAPGNITWTLGGDTSYPKETATVVWQSVPTTPTLVGQTVKDTQTISAIQSITSAGKYDFEVKVQWTNHKKDDLVSQKASVRVKECEAPKDASASVSVTPATCDAPASLVYGNIVNATFSGTPNGTAGPGNYDVTATANSGHKMTDGKPSWNFTGALADKLPKQSTDPYGPCYDKPFDWNWQFTADCSGITIPFPANLPSSQFGVIEVNFRFLADGKQTTINYKLEGDAYWAKYPNGHAGVTLVIPWNDPLWRNGSIPTNGVWTGQWAQVHGTNYHPEFNFQCGSESEVVTGTATFTQLSCVEGSANSAKADATKGGVWTISADGVDSITLPIGEGYEGGVPDGFPFDDITFTLSDGDPKDGFTVTPWTGTWTPVDPKSLDCREANAKAWVEVVEGPTCDTAAKPQFWTENAKWNDDIVPGAEPNTWVRTATAIDGSKFENGESTISVTYTLAPATGETQSEDPGAPCYVPPTVPPTPTPGDISAVCVADVPHLAYGMTLGEPGNGGEGSGGNRMAHASAAATAAGPLTITFLHPTDPSQDYSVTNLPLDGQIIWPGATDGAVKNWPGWVRNADGTYSETDGNFRWTRDGVDVRFEAEGQSFVTQVSYPGDDSLCANPPKKTVTPPTPDKPKPTLAVTGVDGVLLGGIGLVALLLAGGGIWLMRVGRRRNSLV